MTARSPPRKIGPREVAKRSRATPNGSTRIAKEEAQTRSTRRVVDPRAPAPPVFLTPTLEGRTWGSAFIDDETRQAAASWPIATSTRLGRPRHECVGKG